MRGLQGHVIVIAPSMVGKTTFLSEAEPTTRRTFVAEDDLSHHDRERLRSLRPPGDSRSWSTHNEEYVTLLLEAAATRYNQFQESLVVLVHHQEHARMLCFPIAAAVLPPLSVMKRRWQRASGAQPDRVAASVTNWNDVYTYVLLRSLPSVESLSELYPF